MFSDGGIRDMMTVNRRGNLVWLVTILVAAIALWSAGALPVLAVAFLVGMVLWIYHALRSGIPLAELSDRALDRLPMRRVRLTEAAKKATMNASRRPDFDRSHYRLKDIGLVVEASQRGGLQLRQARWISMDDRAIRPYITLQAPYQGHPCQTLVRFAISDGSGQPQLIYEMDHWMRPGENLIIPNYRLPLKDNSLLQVNGIWDLQVWVNGGLLGIHDFSVSPSSSLRRQQFGLDGEAQVAVELDREAPAVALDDLLAQQRSRTSKSG
jgi:hypothetical protein